MNRTSRPATGKRFYAITVNRTLFGAWALVRETEFETEGAAWAAGEQWHQPKVKRSYRTVSG